MKVAPYQLKTGLVVLLVILGLDAGNATAQFRSGFPVAEETWNATGSMNAPQARGRSQDLSWRQRVITEREINSLSRRDPDLSPSEARKILAKLNIRAPYYIEEDIIKGRPIKVPNNFSSYKNWSPLPTNIREIQHIPKFILIMKDSPYVGWYEKGKLVGDTHACIGRASDWTKAGVYRVLDKDINKFSRSYNNAYGDPAPMPWALRIYGLVWIHAGDITNGNCSRGCINLPMFPAMALFEWAPKGTPVLVAESMHDLNRVLDYNRSRIGSSDRSSFIYPASSRQ
jgi:hypothetical protein